MTAEPISLTSREQAGSGTPAEHMHLRTCPLCEAMCGLEITVRRRRGHRHPAAQGGRLQQGPHLPQGHHARASCTTTPTRLRGPVVRDGDTFREVTLGRGVRDLRAADPRGRRRARHGGRHRLRRQPGGPHVLDRALHRRAHRHVRHPADLLRRHRRPVAEERHLGADVRRHVDHPRPRRPAQRLHGRDGREPAGVAGVADGLRRTCWASSTASGPAAARSSSSTRGAPAPSGHATSGSRSRPAPTPRCCSRWSTCCSPRASSTSGRRRASSSASTTLRAGLRARSRPSAVAATMPDPGRPHPRARPRDRGGRSTASSTAGSGCATRSSGRWPAGSSTWSTS